MGDDYWREKTALITGASSGIGEALALELARSGARVGLFARRSDRIEKLAQRIQAEGGWALPLVGDVAVQSDVRRSVTRLQETTEAAVDVLIANAGRGVHGEDELRSDVVTGAYEVNFFGAVYALEAVLPSMRERGRGHIAVISSGTALLPKLMASPTYASSKAAMGRYFEGIGRELKDEGISVTVVYPGFVRTEMTSGHKFLPFALEADHAARLIRRAIERKRRRFIFPRRAMWLGRIVQLLPAKHQLRGRRRLAGKPRQ